jgi:hypothetical protein
MKRNETSTDYARPHRPLPIAALNAAGRAAGRLGWRGVRLDERSIVDEARRRARLHDFGDDVHRRALRVLLDALEREARLTPTGRLMARENLVRVLVNRLRIEADLDRHPEILATPLAPPVVIAGLQRTGTTVVHRLLAQDARLRVLASWEAINPAPISARHGARGGPDPRVAAARLAERSLRWLSPDFFAIHPVEAAAPEEDCLLLDFCFMSTVPEATQRVPSYSAWLEAQDHRPAYRYLETLLKYLAWQRPADRWVLKSPHHLEHLDVILEVFPGATIVQTHRDPVAVVASFASMMAHAYGVFSDEVDPRDVGRRWLRKQAFMIERALDVRDAVGDGPFVDLAYGGLLADPIGQVRAVYDRIGSDLDEARQRTMRAWLGDNPQHKHGRHRYDLAAFGLDPGEVRRAFGRYAERFGLGGSGER